MNLQEFKKRELFNSSINIALNYLTPEEFEKIVRDAVQYKTGDICLGNHHYQPSYWRCSYCDANKEPTVPDKSLCPECVKTINDSNIELKL